MRKFILGITLAPMLCAALPSDAAEPRPTDVITTVCRVPKGQLALTCGDSTVQLVYVQKAIPGKDGSECVAKFKINGKNPCLLPEYLAPWNGATMHFYLHEATKSDPTLCCAGVGRDGFLDVLVQEDGELGPGFDPTFRTIRGSTGGRLPISNVDAVMHEFGHAVTRSLNPAFALAEEVNTKAGLLDEFSTPLQEGLADALAAGLSLYTEGKFGSAEPWVIGDAPSSTGGNPITLSQTQFKRDLRVARQFVDALETDSPDLARLVDGNFFFRVAQRGTFKPNELLVLVTGVTQALKDGGRKVGYNPDDFDVAVRTQFARFDLDQDATLASVLNEMQSVAPDRPVPPPPTNLRRTADLGCTTIEDVGRASLYRMQWSPSPGALSHDLYVRDGQRPFRFENTLIGPIADIVTNTSPPNSRSPHAT